jgi:hypothetical protein
MASWLRGLTQAQIDRAVVLRWRDRIPAAEVLRIVLDIETLVVEDIDHVEYVTDWPGSKMPNLEEYDF